MDLPRQNPFGTCSLSQVQLVVAVDDIELAVSRIRPDADGLGEERVVDVNAFQCPGDTTLGKLASLLVLQALGIGGQVGDRPFLDLIKRWPPRASCLWSDGPHLRGDGLAQVGQLGGRIVNGSIDVSCSRSSRSRCCIVPRPEVLGGSDYLRFLLGIKQKVGR